RIRRQRLLECAPREWGRADLLTPIKSAEDRAIADFGSVQPLLNDLTHSLCQERDHPLDTAPAVGHVEGRALSFDTRDVEVMDFKRDNFLFAKYSAQQQCQDGGVAQDGERLDCWLTDTPGCLHNVKHLRLL